MHGLCIYLILSKCGALYRLSQLGPSTTFRFINGNHLHTFFLFTKPPHRRCYGNEKFSTMVSFTTAIKNFYLKAFKFKGRATRAEFWWVMLFQTLLISLMVLLDHIRVNIDIISLIFFIINIIPNLSIQTRRFHDIGKSGTTLLGIIAIWLSCWFVSRQGTIFGIFGLGCLIVMIWHLILNVRHGQKKDNEYGPNPYAISESCITEFDESKAAVADTDTNNNIEEVEL